MSPSIAIAVLLVTAGAVVAIGTLRPNLPTTSDDRLEVVASFYPLAEFARQVGGEHVSVVTLTPAGVEPHDFEPTPIQVTRTYESDLFVYNGGGIDAWASALAPSIASHGVRTIEMSTAVGTLLPPEELPEEGEEAELFDEHFWLDPLHAMKEVTAIRDALSAIDASKAEVYAANADAYIAKLATLDRDYRQALASCKIRSVVTSHAAFAYMAAQYTFKQLPIAGISPDEEPSAGALAALAKTAKDAGVKYVFFETLVSPELSKTLAREIGAETIAFNPLEGLTNDELAAGSDYLSVMRQNLANLKLAMECHE